MVYRLESGGIEEQRRYELLLKKLDEGKFDSRIRNLQLPKLMHDDGQSIPRAEQAILNILLQGGTYSSRTLYQQMTEHNFYRRTIRLAINNLKKRGLISVIGKRYVLIDCCIEHTADLAVGAPIIYLPGKRSQQRGEIVEIKELRNKPGQYYPVAVLENGRKLFVSEDVTALDKSAVIDEKHQRQVLQLIRNVGEIGIKHNDLARTLFKAKIPGLKNIVKALVKDKLVKRRHTSTGAVYYVPPADDLGLNPVAIQIYRRIAQGVSRDDIAKELGLCAQSVYYHEKRVRVMLDVDDTNGVIQRLKAAGLLG